MHAAATREAAEREYRETHITYAPNLPIYPPQLLLTPHPRPCLHSYGCAGHPVRRPGFGIRHPMGKLQRPHSARRAVRSHSFPSPR